jgi:pentatricopeptide repeat protein
MIVAMAQHALGEQFVALFEEMVCVGMKPDCITTLACFQPTCMLVL